MPENQETEIAKLESFRMEIKAILDKAVENKDGTAMVITDVGELDAEDVALWEELKKALLAIDSLDTTDSEEAIQNELKRILDLTEKLENDTALSIEKAKQVSKNSKIQFGAWIRNKNPFSAIGAAFDFVELNGVVAEAQDVQETFKDIIDLYAKDGWKKQETKD